MPQLPAPPWRKKLANARSCWSGCGSEPRAGSRAFRSAAEIKIAGGLKVVLINHGDGPFEIHRGDRVAQLVLAPVTQAAWQEVEELDETDRGEGGFGSTGGHRALV